jgi:undecaprenyl-diphosphatase
MEKQIQKLLITSLGMLAAFVLWTVAVCTIDVKAIGPEGSEVGFGALNQWFHKLTGVHLSLYYATDYLSLIPLGIAAGFAILGAAQWIKRKSLTKVDRDILVLGGFYVAVIGAYAFFELFPVNYRPIWIEGRLEASYPSSTTVLVACVMSTAVMQLKSRVKAPRLRTCLCYAMTVFAALMIACRLVSGVHWLTDIVGGLLLSADLVSSYRLFHRLCST